MASVLRKRTPRHEDELRDLIRRGDVVPSKIARTRTAIDEYSDWLSMKRDPHMSRAAELVVDELLENTEAFGERRCAWHTFKTRETVPPATYRVLIDEESGAWLAVGPRADRGRARRGRARGHAAGCL
jgi:hypothetical protein